MLSIGLSRFLHCFVPFFSFFFSGVVVFILHTTTHFFVQAIALRMLGTSLEAGILEGLPAVSTKAI
jgi:hypothetical protein